jgi:hypothetical protein
MNGVDGTDGTDGVDALWNFTGAYGGGTSYAVGDIATYNGQTWYRIDANGGNVGDTPSEGTFWTLISSKGADGQSLLYMGDYDYETTYKAGDVVGTAVGGSGSNPYPPQPLYVSLINDNLDNDPSSSPLAWVFLVNRISDDGWASKQNVVSGVDDTEIGYLNGVTSAIQTQLDAKSPITQAVSDKSANYTLQSSDVDSLVRSTGSAITVTVPDVLTNGQRIDFLQAGAGQITFTGSGVTINSADAKTKTAKQYAAATILKAGGSYYLIGNLG